MSLAIWILIAKAALVSAFGLLAVLLGSPVVGLVFALASRPGRRRPAAEPAETATEGTSGEPAPNLIAAATTLRGGAWIGRLERAAVFATLVAGYPAGLAVAVALKGLARYPELKATTSGAAERFIIGTFVSVLFAAVCSGLAVWAVGLF